MNQLITLDRAALPVSVRNARPAAHLTAKYVPINTMEVIDAMLAEGFAVYSAQGASNKAREIRSAYAKHVVDFRLPDAPGIGGAVPRVLFTNSHNGSSRASALAGVFRFVCSNGMVVGSTYAAERTLHAGEAARTLIERMKALARNTAPLFTQIETWQRKQLTASQTRDFARFAAHLRWGDAGRFDVTDLLRVRRPEDDRGDLWTVFNRVQESTVKGGIQGYTAAGRVTTARPLQAVDAGLRYNQDLWRLAEEFAE